MCGVLPFEAAFGTVYRLGALGFMVLHTFSGATDGAEPYGGVILDSSGNLYGTNLYGEGYSGVVYMLNPGGEITVLHTFTGGADGGMPYAGLIMDSAGSLYGTAESGGTGGAGAVFQITP